MLANDHSISSTEQVAAEVQQMTLFGKPMETSVVVDEMEEVGHEVAILAEYLSFS